MNSTTKYSSRKNSFSHIFQLDRAGPTWTELELELGLELVGSGGALCVLSVRVRQTVMFDRAVLRTLPDRLPAGYGRPAALSATTHRPRAAQLDCQLHVPQFPAEGRQQVMSSEEISDFTSRPDLLQTEDTCTRDVGVLFGLDHDDETGAYMVSSPSQVFRLSPSSNEEFGEEQPSVKYIQSAHTHGPAPGIYREKYTFPFRSGQYFPFKSYTAGK
ncbi:hypothetical protein INR49_024689 [Caranx melampygus]|nr:hypothetical protein INR49_024689 [Caranx melampygus]